MIEIIQEASHFWIESFGLIVIQDSLFIILILLLLVYFRNIPAQTQYLICIIVMFKLMIPPFIPYKISSGFLDTYYSDRIFNSGISVRAETSLTQSVQNTMVTSNGIGWIEIVFLLWIAGVLISLGSSISGFLHITFSLRHAQKLERGKYSNIISDRKIIVYISNRITMPLTLAFFPNRIFVPMAWNEWNDQCRALVLKHELTHLKRHDNMIQLFQIVVQAFYFFHPLVYLINKKTNLYREMACDDISIRIGKSSGVEYSKCLTGIAEKAVWTPLMCQSTSAFIRPKSDLSYRIKYQMEEKTMSFLSKKISIIIPTILLFFIPIFSIYVSSAKAEPFNMEKIQDNLIEIRIHSKDDIRIDDRSTSLTEFKTTLTDIAAKLEDPLIDLEFDEQVTMQLVFKIQRILRDLDLLKIRYADDGDKVLNLQLPNTTTEEQLEKIAKEDILTLQISSTGEIESENIDLDISELERFLRENHKKNEYLIVNIKTEKETIYKDFIIVLEEVKKSQSKRVLIYENIE